MPTRNQPLSQDEFRDLVEEVCPESEKDDEPDQIIRTARRLYNESRRARIPEQETTYYKNNYINKLLDFGYRYKGQWEDSGNPAKQLFEDALRVERNIPIAHYRLGHIFFKNPNYGEAVNHFYSAINLMGCPHDNRYSLEDYQLANARKILAFCALEIFEKNKLSALESDMYSELDNQIQVYLNNEKSLFTEKPVVLWLFKGGIISKQKIDIQDYFDLKGKVDADRSFMYIDAYTNNLCAGYGGYEENLSLGQYYLLKDIFNGNAQDELGCSMIKGNTYNQNLRRLRARLCELGLEPPVLELTNPPGANPSISSPLTIYLFMHIEE